MDIKDIIIEIKDFLELTFKSIDLWFDKDAELRSYKPQNGGWTIDQILEHIGLTNHFLLILIDKGTNKALANISKLDINEELKNGEGVLYKTTMTVNDLGKIDVYEYIYFLAQHGQRHITQMTKNETEFNKQK